MINSLSDYSHYFKLGGFLTFIAVVLEAYGAHGLIKVLQGDQKQKEKLVTIFRVGTKYHMLHSMSLFFVPFSNYPNLTASLYISGMSIFCLSLYFYALLNYSKLGRISPIGGLLLMGGWLTFCF